MSAFAHRAAAATLAGLLSVLLCACAEETAPPAPAAREVVEWLSAEDHRVFQVGDFWVTMERGEAGAEAPNETAYLTVWDPEDLSTPLQTIDQTIEDYAFGNVQVVDADFDGDLDFGSMYFMGNQPTYYDFWLWDEGQGRFVEEPVLSEISSPQFDAAAQIVSGYARGGWAGAAGEDTFYRWIDGSLTLIRRVESSVEPAEAGGKETVVLTVEELVEGTMTEVFRQGYPLEEGGWWDVREKWCDLDDQGA